MWNIYVYVANVEHKGVVLQLISFNYYLLNAIAIVVPSLRQVCVQFLLISMKMNILNIVA